MLNGNVAGDLYLLVHVYDLLWGVVKSVFPRGENLEILPIQYICSFAIVFQEANVSFRSNKETIKTHLHYFLYNNYLVASNRIIIYFENIFVNF